LQNLVGFTTKPKADLEICKEDNKILTLKKTALKSGLNIFNLPFFCGRGTTV